MTDIQKSEPLEFGGIRFSNDLIAEVDRGQTLLRIRRDDVQRIALRRGFQAARPLFQTTLGFGLLLAGVYILVKVILELMTSGGEIGGKLLIALATVSLLGGWLFWEGLKRGYYLEVTTAKRAEKLRFARRLSEEQIEAFLASVRSQLGWPIDPPSYEGSAQNRRR